MMNRKQRKQRCGTATVEFALVVPVMLTVTFGLIELSRMSMVKESLTQASREGARVGVRPTATNSDVIARVNQELGIMGLTGAEISVIPDYLDSAQPGDEIHVKLTIPISETSWVPGALDFSVFDIEAETVMRRESTS